jgi:folate-binding protein YgfZ
MPDLAITPLDDLSVLSARGADTLAFLQGQLSQDVLGLPARGATLAGLHNPQGRVLALLRLLPLAEDHVLLLLPGSLADTVRQQLQRYVLRAKVGIEAVGAAWRIYGLHGPDAEAAASTRVHMPADAGGLRQIIVAPRGESLPEAEYTDRDEWRLDDIAAGIPEIGNPVSGVWVAQMLNLDLIGAVSFNKGCYTGQEVIARAHFRGQVKRRMQRFCTEENALLAPGTRITLADGRGAQVVMSADTGMGTREFLAVASTTIEPSSSVVAPVLPALALPLPYAFPDD